MYPILFKIGPFTVGSFGLMMALAFITVMYLLKLELLRVKLKPDHSDNIVLLGMVTGVAGSKLASVLFEEYAEFKTHPVSTLFSGSGLTWHGGLILATIAIIWYIQAQKLPLLKMLDLLGPMLAIGYAIGRIGCQLAGDGDYGRPTDLPWAMAYPNGLVPTLEKVHPAPVYETLSGLIIFGILWYLRPKSKFDGMIFSFYLILAGLARFLVEIIRLNPVRFWGMTDAQIVSVTMVILGFVLFFIWGKKGKEHAGSAPNV